MASANIWVKRVEEWRKSGLSSVAFAEGKDFTGGGLRNMAHVLRRDAAKPREIRLARVVQVRRSTTPSTPPFAPRAQPPAPVVVPGAAIVVVVDGARVEVSRGASREVLAMVFEALSERSSG